MPSTTEKGIAMTAENGSKPTPKTLAIAAIQDAIDEAGRQGGPRPLVLAALLTEAGRCAHEIQELARPRKPKAAKETT
jgi:hypothetical protein